MKNMKLKNAIFNTLFELAPLTEKNAALIEKILNLIDKLVECEVTSARVEVMKNFKAI